MDVQIAGIHIKHRLRKGVVAIHPDRGWSGRVYRTIGAADLREPGCKLYRVALDLAKPVTQADRDAERATSTARTERITVMATPAQLARFSAAAGRRRHTSVGDWLAQLAEDALAKPTANQTTSQTETHARAQED